MLFYVKKINNNFLEIVKDINDTLKFLSHIEITNNSLIQFINNNIGKKKILIPFLKSENYDGLTINDIQIEDFSSDLEKVKQEYFIKVLRIIEKIYDSEDFVKLLFFIVVNNKCLDHNVFITEDNYNNLNADFLTNAEKEFIKNEFPKLQKYNNIVNAYQDFIEGNDLADSIDDVKNNFNKFVNKIGEI